MVVKLTKKDQAAIAKAKDRYAQEQTKKEERIRIRRMLQKTQPRAYAFFERSIQNDTFAHGYLLYGASNAMKEEMAFLLAQSILTASKEGLVIEENFSGQEEALLCRIAGQNVRNLIYLDGYREKGVSKEEVDEIQRRFSHTATESGGKRVWIMTGCENASRGAQNSLLKFLEEPAPGVYALLCTDRLDGVLPTIRSRCIAVPFQPLAASYLYEQAIHQGLDEEDAFFLSAFGISPIKMKTIVAEQPYQRAKAMFQQWRSHNKWSLAADFDVRLRFQSGQEDSSGKNMKTLNMELLHHFFSFLSLFCRHVLSGCDEKGPAWYHKAVECARNEPDFYTRYRAVRRIAWEENDRVNRKNDLSLLFDQTFYRLEDIHE